MSPRAMAGELVVDEYEEYEEYDEYEDDEEELEDEPPRRSRGKRGAAATSAFEQGTPARHAPNLGGLSLGLIAMLPLFIAYELGASSSPDGLRNTSELVLFRALEPLGPMADGVRRGLLAAAVVLALVVCYRRRLPLGPGALRVVLEGALGALLFGPALVLVFRLLDVAAPDLALAARPDGPTAAVAFGGAAYEEILFRVLLYGLFFLLGSLLARFFGGAGPRTARGVGEVTGLVGQGVLFAAFHLALFTSFLGPGGEAYDTRVFLWRLTAGVFLGLIFRLRGPGVAAWTHGLFNLALYLGAGPSVLL